MSPPAIYVVDDDAAVRDSLSLLCETASLPVECFDSAESFLAAYRPGLTGCVVLDVRMGRMSGPEMHAVLNESGCRLQVIYLTAHGDIPMTVRAMKDGAVDFLTKPIDGALLLELLQAALRRDGEMSRQDEAKETVRRRLESLTPREREIMYLTLAGHANKTIAKQLDISYRTVELHRSHILHKMETASMLELARLLADAGVGGGRDEALREE